MFNSRIGIPGVPAPAQPPANQTPLHDAITRRDLSAVNRLLHNSRISPDTLHSLLELACQDTSGPVQTNLDIKSALVRHSAADRAYLQRALDLAVKHNDVALADMLLGQGAVPQRHNLGSGNNDMRNLLTQARRKCSLYPPGADRSYDTDLDRALQTRKFKDARDIVKHETRGASVRKSWADAVKDNRSDILRALLLLGMVDKDLGFRLKEMKEDPAIKIKDAALLATLKEVPQYSPKRGPPKYFNCVVPGIACRHLVYHRQKTQAADPAIKSDYGDVQNLDAIRTRVAVSEQEIQNMNNLATEVHLVDNRKFGTFIAQQFDAMADAGETNKQMAMRSTDHVMSLELRIKEKDGQKVYVAKFHDPNLTTTHARSASDSRESFEAQNIGAYISSLYLEHYFKEPKGVSMMFVRPPDEVLLANATARAVAVAGRMLTSSLDNKEVDATVMLHLLSAGFAGNLRSLKDEIARRPEAERSVLLAARNADGVPGLLMALVQGHADAVKAFGELLKLVPKEQRAELLVARTADGIPGLFIALQYGHADDVKAFGELLKLVPEEQRAELLAARTANGVPGLFIALQKGQADTVKAFGELLKLVPEEQRADLLAAKIAAGVPGLHIALLQGHADAVKAFGEPLKLVPEGQRAALLAAKDAAGVPGLHKAMQKEHAEAVKAFGELLKLVPETQRAALLAAGNAAGVPRL